jgi:hypothetical protein
MMAIRDVRGCLSDIATPYNTRQPEVYRTCPGEVRGCPWRVIRETWCPWLSSVVDARQDLDLGAGVPDWPDAYAAGWVEAVRYLAREQGAAQSAYLDLDRGV